MRRPVSGPSLTLLGQPKFCEVIDVSLWARIDNKLKILGKKLLYAKSHLYLSHITHSRCAPRVNNPRALSIEQEHVLVNQISQCAACGTLLTPYQVHELAELLAEQKLGINWVGRFIQHHKEVIQLRFFAYHEAAHLKANTPKTWRAFYSLVCGVLDL